LFLENSKKNRKYGALFPFFKDVFGDYLKNIFLPSAKKYSQVGKKLLSESMGFLTG